MLSNKIVHFIWASSSGRNAWGTQFAKFPIAWWSAWRAATSKPDASELILEYKCAWAREINWSLCIIVTCKHALTISIAHLLLSATQVYWIDADELWGVSARNQKRMITYIWAPCLCRLQALQSSELQSRSASVNPGNHTSAIEKSTHAPVHTAVAPLARKFLVAPPVAVSRFALRLTTGAFPSEKISKKCQKHNS